MTSSTDFQKIHEAIQIYERESTARLNLQNSQALAIGRWNTPANELGINFQSQIKILAVTFWRTIEESTTATLTHHYSSTSARAASMRQIVMPRPESAICAIVSTGKDLVRGTDPPTDQSTHATSDNNMHVVHMAGIVLSPTDHYTQTTEGARRLSTDGLAVNCRMLLVRRMWMLNSRECSVSASWMEHWSLNGPTANPPNRNKIPNKLSYVKYYALAWHMCPPWEHRNTQTVKRRQYKVLHTLVNVERGTQEMRVTQSLRK